MRDVEVERAADRQEERHASDPAQLAQKGNQIAGSE
jgi:hypothetical protein